MCQTNGAANLGVSNMMVHECCCSTGAHLLPQKGREGKWCSSLEVNSTQSQRSYGIHNAALSSSSTGSLMLEIPALWNTCWLFSSRAQRGLTQADINLLPYKRPQCEWGYNYHVHLFLCKYAPSYSASFSVSRSSYLLILPVSAASLCLHCASAQPSPWAERITVSGSVAYLKQRTMRAGSH